MPAERGPRAGARTGRRRSRAARWRRKAWPSGRSTRASSGSLDGGLELEQQVFVEVFHTIDSRIGVESFREHGPGKANFTGG